VTNLEAHLAVMGVSKHQTWILNRIDKRKKLFDYRTRREYSEI
jgi:hypothetical protein